VFSQTNKGDFGLGTQAEEINRANKLKIPNQMKNNFKKVSSLFFVARILGLPMNCN
jgi:hypothetical protein